MSLPAELTRQFYEWEQRGRGWNVYDIPVWLEPSYQPFHFHHVNTYIVDDGRVKSFSQQLSELIDRLFSKKIVLPETPAPFAPKVFKGDKPLRAIGISFPKGQEIELDASEQFLLMLSYCNYPVSFEILGTAQEITIQLVCREPDAVQVESQLKAFFPTAILQDRTHIQNDLFLGRELCAVDFGLTEEFMRPLNIVKNFSLDPLIGLFAGLEHLKQGEQGMVQILFTGAEKPWAESIIRSVTSPNGDDFFADAPEMALLAKQKIASPFFGVTMRVIANAPTENRSFDILSSLGNALIQASRSSGNVLTPLEGYDSMNAASDMRHRRSHRLGMLLNSRELATLVHFPSASIVSAKLVQDIRKTKTAPPAAIGHTLKLGLNTHQGTDILATLSPDQRLKHTHIIGATGTGKSTLLSDLIYQDISNREGIAVLDPHGDLIDQILRCIPENRLNDVIVFDPSDTEYPIGFNILSAHSEIEKDILSSDLVSVFRRLSTSWGDQMTSVLANSILAFLESTRGGTLMDLRRFLIEKNYRETFLKTVTDPHILYYWQKEYPLLKSSSIGPILTRLDTFLRPKLIRNMVAQKKSLDFEQIINSRKILLVKLSQGLIGTENSYLLGTFIVSKIHQAAMARQAKALSDRTNFYLYIDEFQHFITPSMSSILSGARKYHLGLILAHQDMQQLVKEDTELASAVMANAGTRICFRVGDADAKRFEDGFSYFEAIDLQNLHTGEAIVRIDRPDQDFNLRVLPLPKTDKDDGYVERIVSLSREKYGTPKQQVEADFEMPKDEEAKDEKRAEPQPKEEPTEEAHHEPEPKQPPVEEPKAKYQKEEPPVNDVPPVKEPEPIAKKKTEPKQDPKVLSQHRYLQTLIKRMAESRGYKAVIEEPTPDGKGRVDVGLSRNTRKIACEITVTTPDTWEIHNIEKCLAAGYDTVIVCSTEAKALTKINSLLKETLDPALQSKVLTLLPEALFLYLDQQVAKDASTEKRIKGYRVKVEYNAMPQDVAEQKRNNITRTVAESLRKKKNGKT